MLDKLFNWGKKETEAGDPKIVFGRYSDNNKTVEKAGRWAEADRLFKEKKYTESINAFFDYLRDDEVDNVTLKREPNSSDFSFELVQGSKIVRGKGNAEKLQAEVSLAKMTSPSVPVMRRLLEQNFGLYYSRYALDGDRLCMRFDSDINAANPNKLYYGLKELATKADRQDELLVRDFKPNLQAVDNEHLQYLPMEERQVKYRFSQKWIRETFVYIKTLDADKFSGGIAYLLLTLAFRIDYLVRPEGIMQVELEKIIAIYFAKDEKPAQEKNRLMIEGFEYFAALPEAPFCFFMFYRRSTFAIVAPQTQKSIAETITSSNTNMTWYRDNNYPFIGQKICEYGLTHAQFSFSLPLALTQLIQVFMQVNYNDYFTALGFTKLLYDPAANRFDSELIAAAIQKVINEWKKKYPKLAFDSSKLNYTNLIGFNLSFTTQIGELNFDL